MGVTYPGTQTAGSHFVSGDMTICTEGSLSVGGPLRIPTGAVGGYVATCDARGVMSWKKSPGGGGYALTPVAVQVAAYAAAASDFVPVDTTAGSVTVTLPTAPPDSTIIGVKQIATAGGHTVTAAAGAGDVFNVAGGNATLTLSLLNQGVLLEYAAAAAVWYVTADDLPLSQLDLRYLGLAGGMMTGVIAMGSNKITGLADGAVATDAAAVGQVALLTGATFTSDVAIGTAGSGLKIKEGVDGRMGYTGLSAGGTGSITCSSVTANSRIFLTIQRAGGTPGTPYVDNITPGGGVAIKSTSATDTSLVGYLIIEPA